MVELVETQPPLVELVEAQPPLVELVEAQPPLVELVEAQPPLVELVEASSTAPELALSQRSCAQHPRPMPYAYILECRDRSFYVGSTWDLERRLSEHQLGLGAAYTRRRRPVRVVWHTWFDSIAEAYAWEKQVQGWGRAKRIALIEGRLEDLPGLARTAKPREVTPEPPPSWS